MLEENVSLKNPFGQHPPAYPQQVIIPKGTNLMLEGGKIFTTTEDYHHIMVGVNKLEFFAAAALTGIMMRQRENRRCQHSRRSD